MKREELSPEDRLIALKSRSRSVRVPNSRENPSPGPLPSPDFQPEVPVHFAEIKPRSIVLLVEDNAVNMKVLHLRARNGDSVDEQADPRKPHEAGKGRACIRRQWVGSRRDLSGGSSYHQGYFHGYGTSLEISFRVLIAG